MAANKMSAAFSIYFWGFALPLINFFLYNTHSSFENHENDFA